MRRRTSDFVVLATKTTKEAANILNEIVLRHGMNINNLLGIVIHCIIKSMDGTHEMDAPLRDIIDKFEDFAEWKRLSTISRSKPKTIDRSIYIRRKRKSSLYFLREMDKLNEYVVMIDTDAEELAVTYNVYEILQRVIEACCPKLSKKLQRLADAGIGHNALDVICKMTNDAVANMDDVETAYIEKMFADNTRADNARPLDFQKYKQHRNISVERVDRRFKQTIEDGGKEDEQG